MTTIAGVQIGEGQPCRVVAELSNAHNGKLSNALRWIEEAKAAGADFAKFQAYDADELVELRGDGPGPEPWGSQGWTMRKLYQKAHTPREWFPELVEHCDRIRLPWFSSVFGVDSLEMLGNLGCEAYKIAALDVEAGDFTSLVYEFANKVGVPIIASGRGERIPWADLTLYCPPGYPQGPINAGKAVALDGLSYHGTRWEVPAFVAAQGAHMLEVHVQLDDEPSELESAVSLTVSQLKQLCDSAHRVAA